MTEAEIAADNDKIMGHLSICRECALEKGGSLFPEHVVCTWIGTCKGCGKVKDCHHM